MKKPLLLLLAIAVIGISWSYLGRDSGRKILVIGVDGLDWRIANPLMEAGKLPWLKKLQEEGAWGDLLTLNDLPLSPVIWTSIATGKVPSKHKVDWHEQ